MLSADSYGTGLGEFSNVGRNQMGIRPEGMADASRRPSSRQRRPAHRNAYQAGQAQPRQQPSRGTPYSAYAPQRPVMPSGMLAHEHPSNPTGPNYNPNAARPSDTPRTSGDSSRTYFASGAQPQRPAYQQPQSFTPGDGLGNLAYASPENRPAPFTTSVNFMGQQMEPGQFYGQRDAFISNINEARQPFAMNPSAGRPQMDFGSMWSQAGDMVQDGWQNPLAGLMGQQPQGRVRAGYQGQLPPPPPGSGWVY